jgi:hypothetical protein
MLQYIQACELERDEDDNDNDNDGEKMPRYMTVCYAALYLPRHPTT